ncbi:hypothetical protein [Dyadobacter pollutisoli]|jgi:hypothetical protein|uniref:Uncharacterized protein n=1 Tax=Dyadobacter pollutisoli TaxID=2910158 RepID=A0A9E8SIP3_9BACT|nr:hypothetical protein [Dyadobacter pollutisoli]WAC10440.1 hypothetical protein ON006_22130 [Dyadobacter pollutisoli]
MKTTEKKLVDLSRVKVDPNMKRHKLSPSMEKKVEEAKRTIEELRKSGKNDFLF